jgi:hypothetical protein
MDKRLEDALAFANYRLTLQIQRQNIEARVAAGLLLSYQNAIFKVTQELISFVGLRTIRNEKLLVEDQSGNVIAISDNNEFLDKLIATYDSAMNLKQQELQKLKSARSTAKIVGL